MASRVFRHLSKAQLISVLRRQTGASFHVIMWDNRPVRLSEALGHLELQPDDSFYYATADRVFSDGAERNGAHVNGTLRAASN